MDGAEHSAIILRVIAVCSRADPARISGRAGRRTWSGCGRGRGQDHREDQSQIAVTEGGADRSA